MAFRGAGFSKLRIIFWAFLDSIPNCIINRLSTQTRHYLEFAKKKIVRNIMIKLYGCKFQGVDSESLFILSPEFEKAVLNTLVMLIHKNEADISFVDVGAHIGRYTVLVAKLIQNNGLVVSIEPHPENYTKLLKNIELNGLRNVIPFQVAAWSHDCTLKLNVAFKYGQHSTVEDYGLGYLNIIAKSLDNLLQEFPYKKNIIMKIDVEGAELHVLRGAEKTIKKYRPQIICEVKKKNLQDVKNFMSELKYHMQPLDVEYYLLQPISL